MPGADLPPGALRLLRPDGSVVVPAELAGRVLRILLRDASARVQTDGGKLSTAVHSLLWTLHYAAEAHDEKGSSLVRTPGMSASGPAVGDAATLEESTAEAARRLGCTERHARRLARSGQVPARRVAGVWLIKRAAGAADNESEAA